MNAWKHMVAAGLFVGGAATPSSGQGTGPLTIEMQPLGGLGGGLTRAIAINEAGHIVGISTTADNQQALGFLWTPSGMVQIPPLPGDQSSVAWLINNAGQVFGVSIAEDLRPNRFFVWKDGAMTDGGALRRSLTLVDANDRGHVVGYSDDFGLFNERCAFWSAERGLEEIVPFPNATACGFSGVNASGQAVGSAYESTVSLGHGRAFLYDYDTLTTTFLTPPGDGTYDSFATAINDLGHVVVGITRRTAPDAFETRSYLWTPTGPMVEIPLPEGAREIFGYAINNVDHVVGGIRRPDNSVVGFRWTASDGLLQLPALSEAQDQIAYLVNDRGQVGGHTIHSDGSDFVYTAFLWTEETGSLSLNVPGAQSSLLSGIVGQGMNNSGDVVGNFFPAPDRLEAVVWRVRSRPPTPQEAIDAIADQVATLADNETLAEGEANALQTKLDAALARLDKGKPKEATNVLNAFINQVDAMVKSGRLTAAEGQALTAAARAIVDQMQG